MCVNFLNHKLLGYFKFCCNYKHATINTFYIFSCGLTQNFSELYSLFFLRICTFSISLSCPNYSSPLSPFLLISLALHRGFCLSALLATLDSCRCLNCGQNDSISIGYFNFYFPYSLWVWMSFESIFLAILTSFSLYYFLCILFC